MKFSEQDKKEWEYCYKKGETSYGIAHRYSTSHQNVLRHLKKAGIDVRREGPKGEKR